MWFVFLKILLCLCLTNNVDAYQYGRNVHPKSAYANHRWKSDDDDHNKNYVSPSSTASSWHHTTITPHKASPIHLRHNRFHNLDSVMNRLDRMSTTTPTSKAAANHFKDDYEDDFMADDNYDELEYDDEVEDEDDWVS